MAKKDGFFDSIAGDRVYAAQDFADFVNLFTKSDGVLKDYLNMLSTTKTAASEITVGTGALFIRGRHAIVDAPAPMAVTMEPVGTKRIDILVARLDLNTDERTITLYIKEGESTIGTPVAPTLIDTDLVKEIALYQLSIDGTTLADPTDQRVYIAIGGGGNWGDIEGTITDQTDLITLLTNYGKATNEGTSKDFNNYKTTGVYGFYGTNTNCPDNQIGVLIVEKYLPDWIVQTWKPIAAGTFKSYVRTFTGGTTWSGWTDGPLNANNTSITNQDWNTLISPGIYEVDAMSGSNKPAATYGYGTLVVFKSNATLTQVYYSHAQNQYFIRNSWNGNANWSNWKQLATISFGTAAPGTLQPGEIYFKY